MGIADIWNEHAIHGNGSSEPNDRICGWSACLDDLELKMVKHT